MSLAFKSFEFALIEESPSLSATHGVAIASALGASAAWGGLCLLLGWTLAGVAGVALGAIAGGIMLAAMRDRVDVVAGFSAAAIAAMVLLTGAAFESRSARSQAAEAVVSDVSYIEAIAEDLLWQQAADAPEEPSSPANNLPPGLTAGPLSAEMLQAAEARWQAMTEEERQALRTHRQRWLAVSQGESLERLERGASWTATLVAASLSSVVALLVASWPLLAARYFSGGR